MYRSEITAELVGRVDRMLNKGVQRAAIARQTGVIRCSDCRAQISVVPCRACSTRREMAIEKAGWNSALPVYGFS
jgi:hypothetical protein